MAITFWETIRGQRLADTLIKELPKLVKTKTQYTETLPDDDVHSFLGERIGSGDRYVAHFKNGGFTTVIMEKQ
ncbi:MAG: hypothetical protein IKW37_01295 [Bacteroidaceae bacterium]|nr:hypothetical protein [Bacteroidaceae bacterium]